MYLSNDAMKLLQLEYFLCTHLDNNLDRALWSIAILKINSNSSQNTPLCNTRHQTTVNRTNKKEQHKR